MYLNFIDFKMNRSKFSSGLPLSFEGQFHQRPTQSYSGNVSEKSREGLLKHLEDERRRREVCYFIPFLLFVIVFLL